MREKRKNVIVLFIICLILIPTFIYGGSVQKDQNKVLKALTVSPTEVQLPVGASEAKFKDKLTVTAYYKNNLPSEVVKDYTTNYDKVKGKEGAHKVTICYTAGGCTKKAKVCVITCKEETVPVTPTPVTPTPSTNTSTMIDISNKSINFPYINGYPDRSFRPDQAVTREELATMLARLLTQDNIPNTENKYSDLNPNRYSTDAINYVTKLGLFAPDSAGKFNASAPVTKAEFRNILSKFNVNQNQLPQQIIQGEGELTRAEAVTVLNKLFKIECGNENITNRFTDIEGHPAYNEILCATRNRVQ